MSKFSTEFVKVSEAAPHVLLVELSRKPVNAFSTQFMTEYGRVFDRIAEATDVRAIVLASASPNIFTAGIDLTALSALTEYDPEPARRALSIKQFITDFQHCITAPGRCPVPVIAAVNGPLLGLGFDIISACDVRYATADATFSIKEVDIGLAADMGSLAYLPKIAGNNSLARELAFTGRSFSAVEAEKLGLVSKVIEGGRDAVVKAALELAKVIAAKSPVAVVGTKHLLNHARDHSVAENLEYTTIWNSAMLQTEDVSASVKASMAKPRQQPQYKGIRSSVPPKL